MAKTSTKSIEIAIKEEASPVIRDAEKLSIMTATEMKKATEILSKLNKYNDNLVADMKKVTDPLNAALKEIRGRYNPVKTVLESAIEIIRKKMGAYQTEALRLQKIEEDKIAARVGEGKGKLKMETASKKMGEIEKPDAIVEAESGSLSFISKQQLKVTNEGLIPDEYFILNEKAVLDALKAGLLVPGAEIEIIQVPRNSR